MKLNELPTTTTRSKKRLGQGYGSGKGGHTSSRGQKGQRSRGSIPTWFEGGQLPQIRRFPFIRGKSRFESLTPKPVEINVSALNRLPANSHITPKTLIDHGFVKPRDIKYRPIKILGRGTLSTALIISVPVSKSAQLKIEAAGGKIDRGDSS
jgi:large subunit ribosomal protein L15